MRIKLELDKDGDMVKIDTSFELSELEDVKKYLQTIDPDTRIFESSESGDDLVMKIKTDRANFELDGKEWEEFDQELKEMDELLKEMKIEVSKNCQKICSDSIMGDRKEHNCAMVFFDGDDFEKSMINSDERGEQIIIMKRGEMSDKKDGEEKTIILEQEAEVGTNTVEIKSGDRVIIIKEIKSVDDENETGKIGGDIDAVSPELAISEFNFYPNPGNGKFTVAFELETKDPLTLSVFDITGKKVFSETIKKFNGKYSNRIDISEKGKGTYLLQIEQKGKIFSKKFMIE